MPNDDIIITGLDEGIGHFFDGYGQRQDQNMANALSADATFRQRNNLNATGAADYVYGNLAGRLQDPQAMMATMQNVGGGVLSGAQRAKIEREQQLEARKLQREAEIEQKRLANEQKALETEKEQAAKKLANEAFNPYDNGLTNFWFGGPTTGNRVIVGDGATGKNVRQVDDGFGGKITIARDERSVKQQRQDQLASMGKEFAAQYANQAIDMGINKVSELGGYAVAKAKYALEDLKAKHDAAKAERAKIKAEREALKQQ